MKRMKIFTYLMFLLLVVMVASCEYDFIEPEPVPPPPDPTDTIFFATDVVPIWEDNNCTNCHKQGGTTQLDLTAANAYNSLTSQNLYNTTNPEESRIYTFPHPVTGDHAYKYDNESEADIILQWIRQGAKNN
ncbi:MAG: hypothetical protein ACLFPE_04125 [Bacteroidales bacterium]